MLSNIKFLLTICFETSCSLRLCCQISNSSTLYFEKTCSLRLCFQMSCSYTLYFEISCSIRLCFQISCSYTLYFEISCSLRLYFQMFSNVLKISVKKIVKLLRHCRRLLSSYDNEGECQAAMALKDIVKLLQH